MGVSSTSEQKKKSHSKPLTCQEHDPFLPSFVQMEHAPLPEVDTWVPYYVNVTFIAVSADDINQK